MAYDLFPAVDGTTYQFPPEIRQALATSPELRNTVVPMTTTQRNNLTGAALWDGRVIYNSTTRRLNRYDATATPSPAWTVVAEISDIPTVPPIPVLTDLLTTSGTPLVENGAGSLGSSNKAARADHVHPQSSVGLLPIGAVWDLTDPATLEVVNASSLKYLNGLFVLFNPSSSKCYTSIDGINWTSGDYPNLASVGSVAYGNGVMVGVNSLSGSNPAAYSNNNGVNWTGVSAPANPWVDVTFGGGIFVAVSGSGTASNVAMTSPNGIAWTARSLPVARDWKKVIYNDSYGFMAIANANAQVAISTDGFTWTEVAFPVMPMSIVKHQYSLYMIPDLGGSPTNQCYVSSNNGVTWGIIQLPKASVWRKIISTGLHLAVLNDEGDVAVAKNAYSEIAPFALRKTPLASTNLIAGNNLRLLVMKITAAPMFAYSV